MRQMTALRAVTATERTDQPTAAPVMDRLWDPSGKMGRLQTLGRSDAERLNKESPNRVLSEVLSSSHDAFSPVTPARVIVNGYREGALRYYVEQQPRTLEDVPADGRKEPSPRSEWQALVEKQVDALLSNGELEKRLGAQRRNSPTTPEKELVAAVRREARSEVLGNDRSNWL